MKDIISGIGLIIITAALAPAAYAGHLRDPGYRHEQPRRVEVVHIVHVAPVIRRVEVYEPARDRRHESVNYRVTTEPHRDAAGAMIVGGLIGGVIGHQLGAGRGQDAATVAGVLIGAALGHDAAERAAVTRYDTVYEEHRHNAPRW